MSVSMFLISKTNLYSIRLNIFTFRFDKKDFPMKQYYNSHHCVRKLRNMYVLDYVLSFRICFLFILFSKHALGNTLLSSWSPA